MRREGIGIGPGPSSGRCCTPNSGSVGLEKQLVGALGPISKGEVAMWEPEAGGEGRECVIGGYFSAATALGAGGQHVGGGGGGGSPQQMALDKGGRVWPSAPGAACELLPPLAQREKSWGEGKGCLYSKRGSAPTPIHQYTGWNPGRRQLVKRGRQR